MADSSLIFEDKGGNVITPVDDDLMVGTAKPDTFYVGGELSGNDSIASFGKSDLLVVDAKIFDGNNDGIINFGKNGVLDLDGPDAGKDTITFAPDVTGLRYLGTDGAGHFAYADASVRLAGFKEGTLGDDTFNGTSKAEVFFFDTALDVAWGKDTINKFGLTDKLVTTSKIFDGDNDGTINFDANGKLDLNGAPDLGHGGAQNQNSPWGQVTMTGFDSKPLTALYFDHSEVVGGVTYFYYDLTA